MGRAELEVFVSEEGGIKIISLVGPVDSVTIDTFKQKVHPVCSAPGGRILLDCARLTYLNSRAIALINSYHRQLLYSRGLMVVCGLNAKLVRTFDLLGIGQSLATYPNRDAALAALRPQK